MLQNVSPCLASRELSNDCWADSEPFGDCSLRVSSRKRGPNVPGYNTLGQFCVSVATPFVASTTPNAVGVILSPSSPPKVIQQVVGRVPVPVATLLPGGAGANEGAKDEPMDEPCRSASAPIEPDAQVAAGVDKQLPDATWGCVRDTVLVDNDPCYPSNASEVGNLVQPFVSNNCSPLFNVAHGNLHAWVEDSARVEPDSSTSRTRPSARAQILAHSAQKRERQARRNKKA